MSNERRGSHVFLSDQTLDLLDTYARWMTGVDDAPAERWEALQRLVMVGATVDMQRPEVFNKLMVEERTKDIARPDCQRCNGTGRVEILPGSGSAQVGENTYAFLGTCPDCWAAFDGTAE